MAIKERKEEEKGLEKVIQINRINKVVKGGKRLSFRAFVITGDYQGNVGFGLGKSKEVPAAIKKGIEKSRKQTCPITIVSGTIPHEVTGIFGASKVLLKPARPGTGVIAGGAIRILLEAAGIKDIVAKSMGAGNAINTVKAAMNGLNQLKDKAEEEAKRGKSLPVYVRRVEKEAVSETMAKINESSQRNETEKKNSKPKTSAEKSKKNETPKTEITEVNKTPEEPVKKNETETKTKDLSDEPKA